jgi:glycosyltransferase involved in cell wall biosynthesis
MNCYNGARYLREALDSVIAQTRGDWELVFWDNRSTDASARIVESYRDPRIRYFMAEQHTTLGAARRLAAPRLTGDWIAFLDCDDLWRRDKLERQIALGEAADNIGFVYSHTAIRSEGPGQAPSDHVFQRRFPRGLPQGDIYRFLLRGNFISVPSLLLNRRAFEMIGGFSGKYPIMEDYYVTLNLARRYRVAAVDEPLCEYRLHGGNASIAAGPYNFEDLEIVRSLYPDPRAIVASCRIIARHFRKCLGERRAPALARITRALARDDKARFGREPSNSLAVKP